jgi:diguanylate cyclase
MVAERIRIAIEACVIKFESKTLKVTASIGVSQFESADDVARLIRRSDEALYASKKAGRNCGHWQNNGKCVPLTATDEELPQVSAPEPAAAVPGETRTLSGATFIQTLKRRVTESHRFGIPLSVMHLKIEDYDVISQKHGAAFARQMSDVAEPTLNKILREMDVLAKLDLGEFVAMLPGKTQGEALIVAQKMRRAVAGCVLPLVDRELQIRFIDGIAELRPGEMAQEILARARQAAIPPAMVRRIAETQPQDQSTRAGADNKSQQRVKRGSHGDAH